MKRLFLSTLCLLLSITLLPAQNEAEEITGERTRRFEGTLGKDLGITMIITEPSAYDESFTYSVEYFYHKTGLPITLVQDEKAENLTFREIGSYTAEGEEVVTGRWSVVWEQDKISGTWTSPDGKKKLPVKLQESYPAGSVPLERVIISSSIVQQLGSRRSGSEKKVAFLRVPAEGSDALNKRLATLARDAADSEHHVAATLAAISKHLRTQVSEESKTDEGFLFTTEEDFRVRMNDNGFLTLEQWSYQFAGGAHGNHASTFHVLETATGRAQKLEELVKPGFEKKWAALGAAELRKSSGVKPDAPLTDAGLFEDKLELTTNWFLVPGGIGFNYPPYEIASYATGPVEFILPWKEIIGDLKPGTKVHAIASKLVPAAKQ